MATILVVEDDASTLIFLAKIIQRSGHRVITATNGQEALDIARHHPPDLIISDVRMPIVDGPTLVQRLQADTALCHIPVLMISAFPVAEPVQFPHTLAFLPKPFNANLLLTFLRRLL